MCLIAQTLLSSSHGAVVLVIVLVERLDLDGLVLVEKTRARMEEEKEEDDGGEERKRKKH